MIKLHGDGNSGKYLRGIQNQDRLAQIKDNERKTAVAINKKEHKRLSNANQKK